MTDTTRKSICMPRQLKPLYGKTPKNPAMSRTFPFPSSSERLRAPQRAVVERRPRPPSSGPPLPSSKPFFPFQPPRSCHVWSLDIYAMRTRERICEVATATFLYGVTCQVDVPKCPALPGTTTNRDNYNAFNQNN